MSLQNEIGRIFLDVRDVAVGSLTQSVVIKNKENNWSLSEDHLRDLVEVIKTDLFKSFDRGTDVLLKATTPKPKKNKKA
jgi:hypothetical protein